MSKKWLLLLSAVGVAFLLFRNKKRLISPVAAAGRGFKLLPRSGTAGLGEFVEEQSVLAPPYSYTVSPGNRPMNVNRSRSSFI